MKVLEELCGFIEDCFQVRMFVAGDDTDWEAFCGIARFHRVQSCLFPDAITALLDELEENSLLSLNDDFQVRLLLGRTREGAFVFGPYCCESLTRWDAHILLERCGISRKYEQDLLAYRSAFPMLEERKALHIVRTAMARTAQRKEPPVLRTMDLQSPPVLSGNAPVEQPYADAVSSRYAIELDMMEAIELGDAERALSDWRNLHRRMDFLKKQLGESLETARMSAAVTRTVIRLAAMRTRLSPVIIDQITHAVNRRNSMEKTAAAVAENTEKLIHTLCREIRRQRRENVSYLTSSVRFYLESRCAENVSVGDIAAKMGVSKSHLILRFRTETGTTPVEYLRFVRITKASELLAGTRKTVQEIAADVGIPDANYFVKLFRRQYGVTPTAYRAASLPAKPS
ncbi:MAG: helix-turn-helix transcriptional regulator [Oscillibacter sp.]|nr:helix-turn-helix transcriptional regulator [Oscillibacter sp.]